MHQHSEICKKVTKFTKKSTRKKKVKKLKSHQVIKIMEENMIVIRDPKTFSFNSDLPKDVDENLKQEIEFIIKTIII